MGSPEDENESDDPKFARILEELARSPAVPLEKPESWVGRVLGRHRLTDVISAGGMGTVYRARAQGPDGFERTVAVKVIHPHLARRPGFSGMFVREARLLSRVSHPNVVHVEELGEEAGDHYLVMELVEGDSLARVLRGMLDQDRRFSEALATYLAMQVADGLHATHEAADSEGRPLGIVHRDISPQNVMIASGGHVKLIDFGIAKAKGMALESTTGSLRGKLRYMAPEQASRGRIDRRTDVYALGIVLWEMLTMRTLFRATSDFELMRSVRSPVVDPPSRYAQVPPALESVVMHCLAKAPEERPATAIDVRRMLAAAVPNAIGVDAPMVAAVVRGALGLDASSVSLDIFQAQTVPYADGDSSLVARAERTTTPSDEAVTVTPPVPSRVRSARARGSSTVGWAVLGLAALVAAGMAYWLLG